MSAGEDVSFRFGVAASKLLKADWALVFIAHLLPALSFPADPVPLRLRRVPESWSNQNRREFLQIAARAQDELACLFTFTALGLQRYVSLAKK